MKNKYNDYLIRIQVIHKHMQGTTIDRDTMRHEFAARSLYLPEDIDLICDEIEREARDTKETPTGAANADVTSTIQRRNEETRQYPRKGSRRGTRRNG